MSPTPGTRLGPCEIVASIGAGGMGAVYRARDLKLNRDVAITILLDRDRSDPAAAQRFQREAQAVATLNHPNIVTIHAIEELIPTDGSPPERGLNILSIPVVLGWTPAGDAVTYLESRRGPQTIWNQPRPGGIRQPSTRNRSGGACVGTQDQTHRSQRRESHSGHCE
jgi:serine/threonine protein kinase